MSCHDRGCWDTGSLRIFFMAFIPIFGYCEVFVKNLGDFQCLKDMIFGKKAIKLNTVTLHGCQKFNFTSGSLVHFGHLNIPRFARDVKMAKMDSGTLCKVKFP